MLNKAVTTNRRTCLAALAGITLAGCSGRKKRAIAVIPKATSHMFWLTVQQGAFDAGRELNVDILWNGPAIETDFSRQIQIMDSMIAQHVDGIALRGWGTESAGGIGGTSGCCQDSRDDLRFRPGLDSVCQLCGNGQRGSRQGGGKDVD